MRATSLFLAAWLLLLVPENGVRAQFPAYPPSTPPPPTVDAAGTFAAIDAHALAAPPQVELTLDSLTAYLVEPAKSDVEKARALFRWMTERISFDMDAYDTQHHGHVRPEAVLRNRRAVCYGYSSLFDALALRAGLEAVTIPGYAKGVGFFDGEVDPPQTRFAPNHTWNAVKIDGVWQFIDVTRGAGYIKAQRFRRQFQEQYFCTPPAHLVRTHLPVDPAWQLLPRPLTLPQFDALPYVDAGYLRMGMKTGAVWNRPTFDGNLDLYAKYGWLKVLAAPSPADPLRPGQDYWFLVDAPAATQVAVSQGKDEYYLTRKGTRFEGAVRPRPGDMKLSMRRHPQSQLEPVLEYQVGVPPAAVTPTREGPAILNLFKRGKR